MMNQKDHYLNKIQEAKKAFEIRGKDEALLLAKKILNSLPDCADTLLEFSSLAKILGELPAAISVLVRAHNLAPENSTIAGELGSALLQDQQYLAAIQTLSKAAELQPDWWTINRDLGAAYMALHQYSKALPCIEKALESKPNQPDLLTNMTICLLRTQQHEKALQIADKTIKLNSNNEIIHDTIGTALGELGKIEEAETYYLKAIKINSLFGPSYSNLALNKKFTERDQPFIKKTETLLNESMTASNRAYIHFALSKMYNDLEMWEKAFTHAQKANLLEESRRKEPPSPKNFIKCIKKIFARKFFETHAEIGSKTDMPIFIVGMPRSGTSLIEQIISNHPLAAGAGELEKIGEIAYNIARFEDLKDSRKKVNQILTRNRINEIAYEYLEALQRGRKSAKKITDKMPENYFHLGLITLLFPHSRIIHIVRNPIDTCLSCYFAPLTFMDWTYNPTWIANRYKLYRELMDYWRQVLPSNILLEVNYEDLITNTEASIRRIIEFCGLDWDPACLNFHKAGRPVSTASVWQVRQPLYKTSVKRWQRYGLLIKELALPLGKYLDREDIDKLSEMGIKIRKSIWF